MFKTTVLIANNNIDIIVIFANNASFVLPLFLEKKVSFLLPWTSPLKASALLFCIYTDTITINPNTISIPNKTLVNMVHLPYVRS